MRLPQARPGDTLDAAILGLPCDSGAPYRTGARVGPNAVARDVGDVAPDQPVPRARQRLRTACGVADAGDASVVPGYMEETMERLDAAVTTLVERDVIPVGIGGDHSVSLPALRGRRTPPRSGGPPALRCALGHLARLLRRQALLGRHPRSRRAAEERIIRPEASIQIGMRGSLFRADRREPVDRSRLRRRDLRRSLRIGPHGDREPASRAGSAITLSTSPSISTSSTRRRRPECRRRKRAAHRRAKRLRFCVRLRR